MIIGRLNEDLAASWADNNPDIAHRYAWPVYEGNGSRTTATCYFEIDVGKRIGSHTHDCDETIVLLDGSGLARVEDDEIDIVGNTVVHVPRETAHDVINTGDRTLRLIGFFSQASVKTTFETVLQPEGSKESGTP